MVLLKKRLIFLLILFLLLLNSCTRPYRHPDLPSDAVVARYSSPTMKLINRPYASVLAGDDQSLSSLRRAIWKSLEYYDRIPKQRSFQYGTLVYTAEEVAASMRLFLDVLDRVRSNAELAEALQKQFHLFGSSANPDSQVMLTGYYEPVFEGSLIRSENYLVPVYAVPDDLYVLDLARFRESLKYRTIVYRMQGKRLIPYHTREEIMEKGVLADKAEVLAWMRSPIDLFFLQIQGSGVLRLPSGERLKLSYAGSNGLPYSSIGKLLVEEEKLVLEEVSMGRIREYLQNHPEDLNRVLYHNESYTFFHLGESEEHPRGSLNVPLTPLRSLALDVTVFPKGSLTYLVAEQPEFDENLNYRGLKPLTRFMLAQDTGGAIKGPDRVDVFWGSGPLAEKSAGKMRTFGRVYFIIARKEVLKGLIRI